jgi:hypothetical protein
MKKQSFLKATKWIGAIFIIAQLIILARWKISLLMVSIMMAVNHSVLAKQLYGYLVYQVTRLIKKLNWIEQNGFDNP